MMDSSDDAGEGLLLDMVAEKGRFEARREWLDARPKAGASPPSSRGRKSMRHSLSYSADMDSHLGAEGGGSSMATLESQPHSCAASSC